VSLIYKLLDRPAWNAALVEGVFKGSAVDLADGFIHFSTAAQVAETARRHFSGHADLMMVAVDADTLGEALRWEPSRGGELFPHLYGPLSTAAAVSVLPLTLGPDGAHDLSAMDVGTPAP
jgi:uncharacterized protein (DUF952 family)